MAALIAIDPGPTRSAMVTIRSRTDISGELIENDELLKKLRALCRQQQIGKDNFTLVVEMIASYGMPVGAEVFETCVMIGRVEEIWHPDPVVKIFRQEVKRRLCHDTRANDANVRMEIINRFGGKEAAIGLTKKRGPLYGFHADLWAALAVGMTYLDQRQLTPVEWSDKAIGQAAMRGLVG